MGTSGDVLAVEFERHRSHLFGVAYRLTGSRVDAEDAVQEAWLRLARLSDEDRAAIRDLRAWLVTVVARVCLDRLRSAVVQRERYVGPWLPEPLVVAEEDTSDPLAAVVRDEGVRMAAMVVLDRLTPDQRVAFVLHDAFGVPFAEVAEVLRCSIEAARQHASRGRRAVADADPPPRVDLGEQHRMLERFVAALAIGDISAVVELLHPDAVLLGDGGGRERTARRPVVGPDKVARFLLGLLERYGRAQLGQARPVLVNGDLGLLFPDWPGDAAQPAVSRRVTSFAVRDGKVAAFYDVVNPDKLVGLPI